MTKEPDNTGEDAELDADTIKVVRGLPPHLRDDPRYNLHRSTPITENRPTVSEKSSSGGPSRPK
jgi:hypothetical protein